MRAMPLSWAASRFDRDMRFQDTTWTAIKKRLKNVHVSKETFSEYLTWDREKQTAAKDVGYYIIGQFASNLRHKTEFVRRGTVTLDVDSPGENFLSSFRTTFAEYEWFLHTTRKSSPSAPRYRIHFPLTTDVQSSDEYEALARLIADRIGIERVDGVSFRGAQMMFWPSRSRDGMFVVEDHKGQWMDPAVELDGYVDWHDRHEWPRSLTEPPPETRQDKAADPLAKPGVIGAFNRAYRITRVLEELIPGTYLPASAPGDGEGRWRYHASEGAAGAVVYDDDTALYSHHSLHDPGSSRSLNAWDVCRVHKFGALDWLDGEDCPASQLPSFKAMKAFALGLPDVLDELNHAAAFDDLSDGPVASGPASGPASGAADRSGSGPVDPAGAPEGTARGAIPPTTVPVSLRPHPNAIVRLEPPAEPDDSIRSDAQAGAVGDESTEDDGLGLSGPVGSTAEKMARLKAVILACDDADQLTQAVLGQIVAAGLTRADESRLLAMLPGRARELGANLNLPALRADANTLRRRLADHALHSKVNGTLLKLDRDEEGRISSTVSNMRVLLQEECLGIRTRFDRFQQTVVLERGPVDQPAERRPLRDTDYVRLRTGMEKIGLSTYGGHNDLIRQTVALTAEENEFDSAQEWLGQLLWDGRPRMAESLIRFLGVPDSDYSRALGEYLWTSLAGRILVPGCKVDMMPVLYGPEGIRKSTFVEAIAPDPSYYVQISFGAREDDMARRVQGKLVAEVPELKGLMRADAEDVRAFLSARQDTWVPKYQERSVTAARRVCMVATTNLSEFLTNPTGETSNRRFLPVSCAKVDIDGLIADREQIYAEAAERFLSRGVAFQVEDLAAAVREDHMVTDELAGAIHDWLASPSGMGDGPRNGDLPVRVCDIAREALNIRPAELRRGMEMRIASVLRQDGYERRKLRHPTAGGRMAVLWKRSVIDDTT